MVSDLPNMSKEQDIIDGNDTEVAPAPAQASKASTSQKKKSGKQQKKAKTANVPDSLPQESAPESEQSSAEEVSAQEQDETQDSAETTLFAVEAYGVKKMFGGFTAVDDLALSIPTGTFYGIVGPNGAGKTTTLSMLSGLVRADAGTVRICGIDVETDSEQAKRITGVLPDRFRTFDRLTGRQLLYYYGVLRGLSSSVVAERTDDLARAFDLSDALSRTVSNYSAGMTKKVMLAGALIHSPRVLILDEPFEAVDPVSAAVILEILQTYVAGGGTVILSSHSMDLIEQVCSRVAVIVGGHLLAEGTIEEVKGNTTLEARFVELSSAEAGVEGLEWLHAYSD